MTALKVNVAAVEHRGAWVAAADFAAASRACREFIEAHYLGASECAAAGWSTPRRTG